MFRISSWWIFYALLLSNSCFAIIIPTTPYQGSGDEVRTSDGVTCKNGGAGSPIFDFGVVQEKETHVYQMNTDKENYGVYGRITIPIGSTKKLDCNLIYQLELERLRYELEQRKKDKSSKRRIELK